MLKNPSNIVIENNDQLRETTRPYPMLCYFPLPHQVDGTRPARFNLNPSLRQGGKPSQPYPNQYPCPTTSNPLRRGAFRDETPITDDRHRLFATSASSTYYIRQLRIFKVAYWLTLHRRPRPLGNFASSTPSISQKSPLHVLLVRLHGSWLSAGNKHTTQGGCTHLWLALVV